jgi:hypothetical protein
LLALGGGLNALRLMLLLLVVNSFARMSHACFSSRLTGRALAIFQAALQVESCRPEDVPVIYRRGQSATSGLCNRRAGRNPPTVIC